MESLLLLGCYSACVCELGDRVSLRYAHDSLISTRAVIYAPALAAFDAILFSGSAVYSGCPASSGQLA